MADVKPDVKKEAPKTPTGPVVWEEVLLLILGIIALLFVFIPRFFSTDNISNPNQIQSESSETSFDLKKTYNRIFSEQDQIVRDNRGEVVQVVKTPSLIDEGKSRLDDFIKIASVVVFSFLIFF